MDFQPKSKTWELAPGVRIIVHQDIDGDLGVNWVCPGDPTDSLDWLQIKDHPEVFAALGFPTEPTDTTEFGGIATEVSK